MPKKRTTGPRPMFEKKMQGFVQVVLPVEEKKKLEALARAAGKSSSAWAREVLLEALKKAGDK